MDEDSGRECPMCASRNVSFSEREHSLACRDCGTVIVGKPVRIDLPREEAIEVVHELPSKFRKIEKKMKAKKAKTKKAKKPVKKAKTKKAKKPSKKKVMKSKRKGFLRRLLKRR